MPGPAPNWAPYWHIDAFASQAFAGNQAAVLRFDRLPDDELMAAIAAENLFAASAFVAPADGAGADYAICWFSPSGEIRLCGHASLAAAHALMGQDGNGRGAIAFQTRSAGILTVQRCGDGYALKLPAIEVAQGTWPDAEGALGIMPQQVWRSQDGYAVFLFRNAAEIGALRPDFATLARLGNHQFICTAPGDHHDIVSRVFVPGAGSDEDSVTGSAHAVLAPFWARRLGRNEMTAHQASPRGGELQLRLECSDNGDHVWLAGRCVTVAAGKFYLSG